MRKKGKRLEEGLKTLSASKGKANRMRLQMTTRPSTSTSTSSDLQTPTLSDLQTPTLSDLQTPNDEHFFNLNTPSNTNAVRSKQMKCLLKIFKSKFNQIFLSSGFPMGGKLRSLQEKLETGSSESSVTDIAKEARDVYNSFMITFSFAKDNEEFGEDFIQKIYGTEFAVDELFEVAESLEKRVETLLEEKESNETSSSIRDTVWEYLLKQFSFYDLTKQRSKFEKIINDILEVQPDPENANVFQIAHEVMNKVFAFGLNNIHKNNTNPAQCLEFEEFPLAAPEEGRFHDFECPGINHYYVATSQYYKMLLQSLQTPFPKTIENKANSVQSVEHICNPKTLENYNAKKQAFKEAGKVNIEKKVQEILLFHGTDAANIDSILKEGFNVDFNPKHKSKMQRYGRGIYVAEHPEMAFMYGNIILLCKVALGTTEKRTFPRPLLLGQEMEDIPHDFDSREVMIGRPNPSPFFVIKDKDQVLPYCVINFTRGLGPDRTAPSMSPSHAAASLGANSSKPPSTTTLQNTTHTNSSVISNPGAQPMAGSSLAGASSRSRRSRSSTEPTFTTMRIPVTPVPYFVGSSSSLPGPSTAGSPSPPWPPVSVFFLSGKNFAIPNAAANAARGTMTVTLRDTPKTIMMSSSPDFKHRVEKNVQELVGLQIDVISKLRSRPDLITNERLKKVFCYLQQSDMICAPRELISKGVADVIKLL